MVSIIYRVKNLKNPVAEKFYDAAGLSDDLKTLYISDWLTSSVTAIDIKTKKILTIYVEKRIDSADIEQECGTLFIPELVGSRIISIDVKKFFLN